MSGLPKDLRPIALVVVIGAIMSILDATIVNVALQTLRTDLHVSLSTIQWVSTAYLLALASVIPLTGWMAERLGPRTVWMASVAAFVVTSVLCGAAWNAGSLIAFRVLQGLAGGMIMPIGMITLAQAAGPQRMGRVMSVVGVPMLLGPVLGPVIGGLLVDNLSWRWIFYVNLPIGLVGLVLAWRLLPKARAEGLASAAGHATPPLDKLGLLLLSPGVAAVVFGLSEIGTHGTVGTPSALIPLAVGLSAIVAFVLRALRIAHPLVEVRLFRGAGFSAAAGTIFLLGAALFGSMILLPLYYQLARGASPLEAGLLMTPQGIGAALGMNVGGRLTDRIGAGRVVPVGLVILAVGTIPYALIGGHTPYLLLMAGLFVRGLGLGATMMPAMAAAYATLGSASEVPRATPMLNVLQRIGGSLGVAILTVVLQNRLASNLGSGAGGSAAEAGTLPAALRDRFADPLGAAFAHAYAWSLAAVLIALVPALLLMREERRARTRAAAADGEPQPAAAPPVPA
ncbi:DHA2 family efflux MFS transporter permease subunit [Baekduia soli]|uniref:DHA2 family efflux MFS transporter permease subunit n=1 Tax=Baekduia soli TaxID=496014 RepID=A0A5B8TZL9_9ACTN|nr:DHA2 family efflux MFS transporter permease subunit [Baekduia soli]QEC46176.1 DHA2 family efflux MFS transporter permease subunit [Baekduia soli]